MQFRMSGEDVWGPIGTGDRFNSQPQFIYNYNGSFEDTNKDYSTGYLRWSQVWEWNGSQNVARTGWVLCYANGKPITYADNNQPGEIRVSASGSYMTL